MNGALYFERLFFEPPPFGIPSLHQRRIGLLFMMQPNASFHTCATAFAAESMWPGFLAMAARADEPACEAMRIATSPAKSRDALEPRLDYRAALFRGMR